MPGALGTRLTSLSGLLQQCSNPLDWLAHRLGFISDDTCRKPTSVKFHVKAVSRNERSEQPPFGMLFMEYFYEFSEKSMAPRPHSPFLGDGFDDLSSVKGMVVTVIPESGMRYLTTDLMKF